MSILWQWQLAQAAGSVQRWWRDTTMRKLITHILLATFLLFAQQVGFAHAVAHGGGHAPTHQHGKGLPMQGCDECLAFAQVQGAPGAVVVHTQLSAAFAAPETQHADDWTPVRTQSFSARGPPARS